MALATTTAEADAVLVQIKGDPQIAGTKLTRAWTELDVTAVDTLYAALLAVATYTNPQADAQAYTGTFLHTGLNPIEDARRHGRIEQELTKVTTPSATFSTLSGATYKTLFKRNVEHPFTAASAYDPTVNTEIADKVTYRWENINPASYNIVTAYTEANWESIAPSGYAFAGLELDRAKDNTLVVDAIYDLITSKDVAIASYTSKAEGVISGTPTGTSSATEQAWHEQGTDSPPTSTPTTGQTIEVKVTREQGGKFTKLLRIITDIAQSVASHVKAWTFNAKTEEVAGRNLADADITSTYTLSAQQAQGVTVTVEKEKTRTGLWNATKRTVTAIRQTLALYIGQWDFAAKTQTSVDKNLTDAQVTSDYPALTLQTQGVTTSIEKTDNPDGSINVVKRVITAIRQTLAQHTSLWDFVRKVQVTRDRNMTDAEYAAASYALAAKQAQGVTVELDKTDNPDGTLNAVQRIISAVRQTIASYVVHWDFASKTEAIADKNLTDEEVAASYAALVKQAQGVGVTIEKTDNSDGSINVLKRTITAVRQTLASYIAKWDFTAKVETIVDKNMTDAEYTSAAYAIAAQQAQGVTATLQKSDNPDGTVNATKTTVTAVAGSAAGTGGAAGFTEATTAYRNQSAVQNPGAGTTGVTNSVNNRLNDDGTFDSQVTIKTAVALGPATGASGTVGETVSQEVYANQSTAKTPAAGGQGVTKSVSNRINPDGTIDATVETRTAVAQTTGAATAGGVLFTETDQAWTDQNAIVNPLAGAVGVTNQVSNTVNKDGTFNSRVSTRTAVASTSTEVAAGGNVGVAVSKTVLVNQAAVVTQAAGSAGTTYAVSNSRNQDGTYDAVVTKEVTNDIGASIGTVTKTPHQTTTATLVVGSATAPDIAGTYGSKSLAKHADGRYYGVVEETTYNTYAIIIPQTWSKQTGLTRYTIEKRYDVKGIDGYAWRRVTHTYTVDFHTDEGSAWAAITAGYPGSGVTHVMGNIWRSIKVTGRTYDAWTYTVLNE